MPLPHTTRITNTKPFFFSGIFLSHIFFTFCLLYFSLISIFLHTLLHILSSFKFQHLSLSNFVSHIACLTQYPHFNKEISVSHSFLLTVRLRFMAHQESRPTSAPPKKNREISANPKKMKNNKERERESWSRSLTKDWIRAKQMKGRYCTREDFAIFRCFLFCILRNPNLQGIDIYIYIYFFFFS